MKKKHKQREDFYSFYSSETKQEGEEPAFKIAKKPSSATRMVFALFVGLLAASAWFGYLFFNERLTSSGDPVTITVKGPTTAENGSLVEYTVSYRNTGTTPFSDAALFADYPPGFTVVKSEPSPENVKQNFWNIGSFEPGQRGEIRITGTITGFENDERTAVFSLQYTNPTYHSAFTVKDDLVTRIEPARAERLGITGPKTINAGSTAVLKIYYQDVSRLGNPESVILKLSLPQGITLEDSEPTVSDPSAGEWNGFALSQTIRPNVEGGILTATLRADETIQGNTEVGAQLLIRDSARGDAILLAARHELIVLRSDLALGITSIGSKSLLPITIGGTHALTVNVTNTGNITFRDIDVWLETESALIDWSTSRYEGGQRLERRIAWTAKNVEGLQELESGETLTLPLEIGVKGSDAVEGGGFAEGITLAFSARIGARVDRDGTVVNEPLDVVGPQISLTLASDARLRAFVRDVTEGVPNKAKTFRVYYAITNSLYPLDDLSVTALLPDGVTWIRVNSRSAGDITHDAETAQVSWTLNVLPSTVPRIDGSFDIAVPVGRSSTDRHIIENIIFHARDRQSGAPIEQRVPGLTPLQTDDIL